MLGSFCEVLDKQGAKRVILRFNGIDVTVAILKQVSFHLKNACERTGLKLHWSDDNFVFKPSMPLQRMK